VIASLNGQVRAIDKDWLVLQTAGVGFRVFCPATLLSEHRVGQTITLHTHLHVRENGLALYGLATAEELELFEILLGVSRIGPRIAMAILDTYSPEVLRGIVAQGNAAALANTPGIGRKTAERLLLDLKDKLGTSSAGWVTVDLADGDIEVINALTALGYSVAEARDALTAIPEGVTALDERILAALRALGR
jgi:Holliday junction DNA helicase RuvA